MADVLEDVSNRDRKALIGRLRRFLEDFASAKSPKMKERRVDVDSIFNEFQGILRSFNFEVFKSHVFLFFQFLNPFLNVFFFFCSFFGVEKVGEELVKLYRGPWEAFRLSASGKMSRSAFIEGLQRLRYDEPLDGLGMSKWKRSFEIKFKLISLISYIFICFNAVYS